MRNFGVIHKNPKNHESEVSHIYYSADEQPLGFVGKGNADA